MKSREKFMARNKKLDRFYNAQNSNTCGYDQAFSEIQDGRKRSHWIWYIFPQLENLGKSPSAKLYGIKDFNEACDYLKDPVLFNRYFELIKLIEEKLKNIPLPHLMGGFPDDRKFISSLTLFQATSNYLSSKDMDSQNKYHELYETCNRVFKQIAPQGYSPCQQTELLVKHQSNSPVKKTTEKSSQPPQVTIFSPKRPKPNTAHPILKDLDQYIHKRENEWSYHYNFLGLVAFVYFIQDLILGTDYLNDKARHVKLTAASKLQKILDPQCHERCNLNPSERKALSDGRLGEIINKHGGLNKILTEAPGKPPKTGHDQEINISPFS
ncbi:TPA: DUF1810 family protein [Legionella pneumophila subsp. pneumophila]|nr:DUF1810 family protein [Legionella pneumophila]HAT3861850.1 DUF1810 family protein [Legionella pneumophila]HAT8690058.1 DUF1810 family protein [Legionella pneumophila]HAT8727655.1 DUF1810 family protein [Legionella pneumophila]HAT9089205.1 DUF1810 family protein [Legionella pneumophila subsp. pneumophila]